MKGKFVSGILAVTGLLALSSTVAQAGGGGSPSALTSFFVCHTINGANLGQNVDVYSDEAGAGIGAGAATRKNVTIGQAILACAQAFLFRAGVAPILDQNNNPTNNINPGGLECNTFELKCYTASVSKKTGDAGLFDAKDGLFREFLVSQDELDIPGSRDPKLICAPACFTE
jgi:hypothetical protein